MSFSASHPPSSTTPEAPVIAIDGPSGSGKGTVARKLARRLGWGMLDSGALYRLVAVAAEQAGLSASSPADVAAAAGLIPLMQIRFELSAAGEERILLDGADVTQQVRRESTGNLASRYAVNPAVRGALLQLQRNFRKPPGLVADGRDMGTVVFPDAELKFFLTASVEERTRRRVMQLSELGITANIDRIYSEIEARDARDRNRSESPLVAADEAIELDTSELSAEQVLDRLFDVTKSRFNI